MGGAGEPTCMPMMRSISCRAPLSAFSRKPCVKMAERPSLPIRGALPAAAPSEAAAGAGVGSKGYRPNSMICGKESEIGTVMYVRQYRWCFSMGNTVAMVEHHERCMHCNQPACKESHA